MMTEEGDATGGRMKTLGLWLLRAVAALCIVYMLVTAVIVFTVYPFFRDDWRMDTIVEAVVRDWRDFGEPKAVSRLEYELDRNQIGLFVSDDSCEFLAHEQTLVVRCAWSVLVTVPGMAAPYELSFSSEAEVPESP